MPPAGAAAFAELEARLREAEERVLRLHFPAQITRVSLTDEDGLVLEPPGQPVEFRVIEHKGEVTLLHTCLIATAAELDYLERAAHLYQTRNTSPSLIVIKPHLVTLAVGTGRCPVIASAHSSQANLIITHCSQLSHGSVQATPRRRRR